MYEGILSAVGNTPLVRLSRIFEGSLIRLFAKLETLNPGGSIKDRPALHIIAQGMRKGIITEDTVVIESSSGNMGIGLAQACSFFGLRFICVVDPKTTLQNIHLLNAYGAEIDLVPEPDPTTGEFLQARISRVKELVETTRNSFWPNQYSNPDNSLAHYQTMEEIVRELKGDVDYLFCATSTCGTLRGCSEFARQRNLKTKIFAVDAIGSVIFGGEKQQRLIPGHGAAVRPPLFQTNLADECIHVSDLDCVIGCRRLARQEAVLVGGSSGALIMAIEKIKQRLDPGATCVVIFHDRGERYLDTIYSDEWVRTHFGAVSHLWTEPIEDQTCVTATY